MDEEDNIADCLASAGFAAEWIVVDSHSRDATRERAAAAGARVIERDWPGHVEQKNFAVGAATHDWVLCLDADERVSPELKASILAALDRPDLPDGFEMPRLTRYLGRWIRRGGWYPDRKVRLFRRTKGRWGGTNPHDHVHVDGRVERLTGDIHHYSYRSISDHLKTIDFFTTIAAREKRLAGRKAGVVDFTLRPFGKFLRMYVLKLGFLEGFAGFVVAATGSFYVFLKYAKLRELERQERAGRDGA
jgi:glycosyltransferase involved in cell wall biosynthesis